MLYCIMPICLVISNLGCRDKFVWTEFDMDRDVQLRNRIITKTCPSNTQRRFSTVKIENFIRKILIVLIFLIKTFIMGTCQNRLAEAVLMSTHNLFLGAKIRKNRYTLADPSFFSI